MDLTRFTGLASSSRLRVATANLIADSEPTQPEVTQVSYGRVPVFCAELGVPNRKLRFGRHFPIIVQASLQSKLHFSAKKMVNSQDYKNLGTSSRVDDKAVPELDGTAHLPFISVRNISLADMTLK